MSDKQEQLSFKIQVLEHVQSLATAGFGLVAALAWNEAIQALFRKFFPDQGSLVAKFVYALFVTVLVVIVTRRLGNAIATLKTKLK